MTLIMLATKFINRSIHVVCEYHIGNITMEWPDHPSILSFEELVNSPPWGKGAVDHLHQEWLGHPIKGSQTPSPRPPNKKKNP
jgi:hypothetical protein